MKKILLSLIAIIGIQQISVAQQPMTISPGLVVNSPTAGTSGLRFSNLNSGTTVSTTPTKVLSLDASGNVILGNAASGGTSLWTLNATTNRIEASSGVPNGIEASRFTSQASSSLASPLINSIGGTSTFFRYGRPSSIAAIVQESTTGFTQATSSINWKFADESSPQVVNTLFDYSAGTFTVNGFTKLGDEATTTTSGVTKSSPAIKTILLTGTLTSASNPETAASLTTTVAHGLTYSKIVDVKVLVLSTSINGGRLVAESFTDNRPSGTITGYEFSTITDGNNVYIIRTNGNSANIGPNVGASVTANYKILISYIP